MTPRYTLDLRDEHVTAIREICSECGMEPLHLVAAVYAESGWRTNAANPRSSARGLCQWMKENGKYCGKYTEIQFIALGLAGQLKLLRDRYLAFKGYLKRLGDVYAVIAAPAAVGINGDEAIYARTGATRFGKDTSKQYAANRGWDLLDTGAVTIRGLGRFAMVNATGPRFHELVLRVTEAESPWLDLSRSEDLRGALTLLGFDSLRAYQEARGLLVDGVLGPKSKARILADIEERSRET